MRRGIIAFGTMCLFLAGSALPGNAEQNFKPEGYAYSPGNDTLPPVNSQQNQFIGQTDIYETEIYNSQRERAVWEGEMRRLIQHDFRAGTSFQPRY